MGPRALKRLPSTGLIISCLGIGASSCDGDTGAAPSATAGSESSAVPSTLLNETTSELASSDPTSDSPTTLAAPRSFDGDTPDAAATSPTAAETGHDETTTAASPATENDQPASSTAPDAGRESDASAPVPANWPSATPDVCTFAINGGPSPQISMVGVVDWSTDLAGVTAARIEFFLNDPKADEFNVGGGGEISATNGRAFMLGLKSNRSYTYHLVVEAGETMCVSSDHELVTPVDPDMPLVLTQLTSEQRSNGFIVASAYGSLKQFIVDADGDVVWWFAAPVGGPRIHMDWDGQYMWMLKSNESTRGVADNGSLHRVRMDGSELEEIPGLETTHHDFAVLPGGVTAFLMGDDSEGATDDANYLVERAADGAFTSLARLDASSLIIGAQEYYHQNALRYVARDDSYTVSDLAMSSVAKFNRQGECLWQVSGACSTAPSEHCAATALAGTHGHELLPNGNLIDFQIAAGLWEPATIVEHSLGVVDGILTAQEVWSYTSEYGSIVFGDVQRLPNGNTLITYSNSGPIQEVSPDKQVVRQLEPPSSLGYTTFRESLYGPPQ